MITFNYNLKWNGPIIISRVEREVKRAVRQSAERVRRTAKDPLLNTSGQAFVTPTGLNRLSAKEKKGLSTTAQNDLIRMRGLGSISGLTAFRARPVRPFNQPRIQPGQSTKQVAFGGSYKGVNRIYWNSTTHRWTTSSQPGTPPHKQQGGRGLQGSIAVQVINDGMRAKIGPGNGLKYGRIQELGGRTRFGTLPPRPYMRPALELNTSAILQDFYKAVARATS